MPHKRLFNKNKRAGKKTERIVVKVTPELKKLFRKKLRAEGITGTDVVELLIFEWCKGVYQVK